jgi:O-succinylbenzoate synthase
LLTSDVVPDSLRPKDGWLPVPTSSPAPEPGLVDADETVTAYWRDRLRRVAALLD